MKEGQIGTAWGKALTDNEFLVHLDLSFNKICQKDTEILANALDSNHSLVGFHYNGNSSVIKIEESVGKIDSLGFMKMIPNKRQDTTMTHFLADYPSGSPYKSSNRRSQNYPVHYT